MKKIIIIGFACLLLQGISGAEVDADLVPSQLKPLKAPASGRVIEVTRDFEERFPQKALTSWRWAKKPELMKGNFAVVKSVSEAYSGKMAMQLTIKESFPWDVMTSDNGINIVSVLKGRGRTSDYFFPPETDFVRVYMKVLEGEFRFYIGAETIYPSSASNVYCSDQIVRPAKDGAWQAVDFSLYKTLARDRYSYAYKINTKAPVYFSRHIQHIPALKFSNRSYGKVLIDRIELISAGKSKPFPVFEKKDVHTIAKIADFEKKEDMNNTFTAYMTKTRNFSSGIPIPKNITSKKNDIAAPLTRFNDKISKSNVLEYTKKFHEEHSYVGVKLPQEKDANALHMKVYMEHLSNKTKRTILPFDFFIFVAPDKATAASFPFKKFEAPDNWKKYAYTYVLERNMLSNTSLAFYHVRRGIENKKWNTLVIPFADFACVYGTGSMEDDYLKQKPIKPENIFAVMFITPHYPLGYADTKHMIDDISLVKVPGTVEQLRSYWQMPPEMIEKIKFIKDPVLKGRGGVFHQVIK